MKHSLTSSESGFSIPSVMIGLAIMSALSLAMTQFLTNSAHQVYHLEDKLESLDFKKELSNLLSDSISCSQSLGGVSVIPGMNITSIKDTAGAVVFSENQLIYPSSRLLLTDLKLVNVNVPAAPGSTGNINLTAVLARQSSGGPKSIKPVEVKLSVTKAPGLNTILSCSISGDEDIYNACIVNNEIKKNNTSYPLTAVEVTSYQCNRYGTQHITKTYNTTNRCHNRVNVELSRTLASTVDSLPRGSFSCSERPE